MLAKCPPEQIGNVQDGLDPEPYSGHDAILSLRFETKGIWPALKATLGVCECGAAIALDLYAEALTKERWTNYSRAKRHYAAIAATRTKWQVRDGLYTYTRVLKGVEALEVGGWIEHDRASPGDYGWQSRVKATPALVDRIRDLVRSGLAFVACRPSAGLVLRDAAGEPIPIRPTAETRRMEAGVERVNEGLRAMRLEGAFPACVIRICNVSLERGGRFYLEGGGVQIKSEAERLRVRIGGERVAEVDYKALHPTMLYHDAGLVPPTDPYDITGWPRDLVKVALLALINAPTFGSAIGALAHDEEMETTAVPGTKEAFRQAGSLIEALKRLHRPIASAFHSGAGAYLMRRESDVLEDVMTTMLKRGESVLPVHDSAICRASQVGTLQEAMAAAAERAGLKRVRITTVIADGSEAG